MNRKALEELLFPPRAPPPLQDSSNARLATTHGTTNPHRTLKSLPSFYFPGTNLVADVGFLRDWPKPISGFEPSEGAGEHLLFDLGGPATVHPTRECVPRATKKSTDEPPASPQHTAQSISSGIPHLQANAPPYDPTVDLCLGS